MPTSNPDRFRDWMARAGLNQSEVARQLGVQQPQVSHLVMGTRSPSLALAVRIQKLTGIPAADWVDLDADKVAPV